jgi:hypothetical protein
MAGITGLLRGGACRFTPNLASAGGGAPIKPVPPGVAFLALFTFAPARLRVMIAADFSEWYM